MKFRDDSELINLSSGFDVVIIAELLEAGSAVADFQSAQKKLPMILEAVPGKPGAVVEANSNLFREILNKRPGEERVLQRGRAVVPGTQDMNRTRIQSKLFTDCTVVHKCSDQHALGLGRPGQGTRAVGRAEHERGSTASFLRIFARGIAQIEAGQRPAIAFAAEKHSSGTHAVGKSASFVDLGTRSDTRAAGGKGVHDCCAGTKYIDDYRYCAHQASRPRQLRQQMNLNLALFSHT